MFRNLMVLLVLVTFTQTAFAASSNRPFNLACFTEQSLAKALQMVTSTKEFYLIRQPEDKQLRKLQCKFVQIPSGTDAIRHSFYPTKRFYFVRFVYKLSNTTNIAAEKIAFPIGEWYIQRSKYLGGSKYLVPRNCAAYYKMAPFFRGEVPDYVIKPRECRQYKIK